MPRLWLNTLHACRTSDILYSTRVSLRPGKFGKTTLFYIFFWFYAKVKLKFYYELCFLTFKCFRKEMESNWILFRVLGQLYYLKVNILPVQYTFCISLRQALHPGIAPPDTTFSTVIRGKCHNFIYNYTVCIIV